MINSLKQNLIFIFQNAQTLDYLAYGWVVLALLFFMFIGIFCAVRWWWQIGFLIIFCSFIGAFFAIYFVNLEINKIVRSTAFSQISSKQLEYSNTLLLDFNLTNTSKKEFKICKVDIKFHTISKNVLKNYLNSINPFLIKTIFIKDAFYSGETKVLNSVVNNFAFVDYNITTRAECF